MQNKSLVKTQIRLNSVIPKGIGGPESGAINLIYFYLLQEFSQQPYRYISINQIGDDLNEFEMLFNPKDMHVNIRFPLPENVGLMSESEKNHLRLKIMHEGLLRIANKFKTLDPNALEKIRLKILEKDFEFDFILKIYKTSKNKDKIVKILVHPETTHFDYFILIEEKSIEKCRIHLYKGLPTTYYFDYFFSKGKWKGDNEFIISGKKNELEIYIMVDECKAEYRKLDNVANPTLFEQFYAKEIKMS